MRKDCLAIPIDPIRWLNGKRIKYSRDASWSSWCSILDESFSFRPIGQARVPPGGTIYEVDTFIRGKLIYLVQH